MTPEGLAQIREHVEAARVAVACYPPGILLTTHVETLAADCERLLAVLAAAGVRRKPEKLSDKFRRKHGGEAT